MQSGPTLPNPLLIDPIKENIKIANLINPATQGNPIILMPTLLTLKIQNETVLLSDLREDLRRQPKVQTIDVTRSETVEIV